MTYQQLPNELRQQLRGLDTVSNKIRLLSKKGFERAEIARILGKRYQHVRNVLEQDLAKAKQKEREKSNSDLFQENETFQLEVSADRKLEIPSELMAYLDFEPGEKLTGRIVDGELHLISVANAIRKLQALAKQCKHDGESVVDELIADRRRDALNE